jgi:hypothetical protein
LSSDDRDSFPELNSQEWTQSKIKENHQDSNRNQTIGEEKVRRLKSLSKQDNEVQKRREELHRSQQDLRITTSSAKLASYPSAVYASYHERS